MEQQTQKKEWKKPELIVLVRGKPEEAVLTACKVSGPQIGAQVYVGGCPNDMCMACLALGTS